MHLKYLNVSDEEDPKDLNLMSKTNPQCAFLENALPSAGYKEINSEIDVSIYLTIYYYSSKNYFIRVYMVKVHSYMGHYFTAD